MFSRYRSSFNPYLFSYPNYSYNYDRRNNRGNNEVHRSPSTEEYHYGRARDTPRYWERDRAINNYRHRSRGGRSTGEETVTNERENERPATPPAPRPKPEPDDLMKVLNVKAVDLHISENTVKHKTDEYVCTKERSVDGKTLPADLVVRRGDTFKITLTFDRPYSNEKNDVTIKLTIGKHHAANRGTEVEFLVDETGNKSFKPDEWGALKLESSGNDVTIAIHVPVNCIVGEWNLHVRSHALGKTETGEAKTLVFNFEHERDIIVLFNPWKKGDGAHMEERVLLDEYVLNPSGCVYRGNAWTRGAKEWNFGQEDILQAALFLMRKGFKEDNSRAMADPVKVSRVLVKMVNSQDDNGVLVGNWSGDYADGTAPTAWVGSVKILRQYMSTGKPVQYGQCWVFSCVTTTLCRALGIPCRTVTNFASAHDTDGSNCIEKYFRLNGNALEKADVSWSGDSVWNFHVWNEVWLSRPDLEPRGHYDGWQVIDATPQETSEGVYTCGPCPLVALKAGECGVKFDTGFVFAEVNADEVHWELLPGGGTRRLKVDKKSIGKFISTKIPDGKPYKLSEAPPRYDLQPLSEIRRLDITDLYKYPEGSEEERKAVLRAHQTANHPVPGTYETESVVEHMEYHLRHSQEVLIGDNLPLEFTATNTGSAEREIMLASIRVASKAYTGETGRIFFEKKFSGEKIASGKTVSFKTVLTVADYLPNLMELAGLYIEATATVKQLGNEPPQSRIKTHDFRFRRPDLDVKGPQDGKARLGEPMQFVVSFTNPLPQALINCDISMESDAFEDIKDEHVPDVPAKAVFEKTFKLIPTRLKQHAVIFSFDCKTLKDIAGSATVTIEK